MSNTTQPIRIYLLGSFEIAGERDIANTTAWRSQQNRTILKMLLLNRRHLVNTDQLLEILWPEESPDVTRPRLYVRMSQIRRMLDPDNAQAPIQSADGGYRFDPDPGWWIDVEAFESTTERGRRAQEARAIQDAIASYEEARRLYRGDLLEGDRYADWTFAERERLLECYLTMVTELAEAYAQQGRYRRAISLYQDILRRDPYREVIFVRLMLAYYYAGEQVQALRTYERCRRMLTEELDVNPLPSTRALAEQIRAGTLWADETFPRYPPPAYRGRLFEIPYSLGHTPLVGREREYAWLVARCQEAHPGLVLVEGEAGVGKTRLVEEVLGFMEKAQNRVLRARPSVEETTLPYATMVDALRPLWNAQAIDAYPVVLRETLRAFFGPPNRATNADAQRERRSSTHQVERAVIRWLKTQHPNEILLFVDDASRLDNASLELSLHLSQLLTVIVTARTEELSAEHPLRTGYYKLAEAGHADTLRLKRLLPSAVETLLRRLAQRAIPTLSTVLIAHTDGNPFFLIAALQALFEEGTLHVDEEGRWSHTATEFTVPTNVQAMIEARLQRLDREQRHVFDAITVIGRDFDFVLLEQVVKMDETALLNTLDTLLGSGLVIEPRAKSRGEFAPAHDLYVEVARTTLPRVRWRRLNSRVADALQALYPGDPALSARLAHHYYEADRLADAVPQAMVAGEIALNRYAVRRACSHFETAAQWAEATNWTPEPSLQTQLHAGWAEALRRSGQPDAALTHYAQALSSAQGLIKLHLVYQMAALQTTQGESPEAFGQLTETLEAGSDDGETLALLRCSQGFWTALRGEPIRARRRAAEGWQRLRHLKHSDGIPSWLIRRATIILARTHALWGEWGHARRYAQQALMLNTTDRDVYGAADAHVTLAQAHYGLGELAEARTHADQALKEAEEAGDLRLQGKALYPMGQIMLDEGRLAEAQQVIQRLLDIAEQTEDLEAYARGRMLQARGLLLGKKALAAQELLNALLIRAQAVGVPLYIVQIKRHLAEAALTAGNYGRAQSMVDEALELAKPCRMQHEIARLEALKSKTESG